MDPLSKFQESAAPLHANATWVMVFGMIGIVLLVLGAEFLREWRINRIFRRRKRKSNSSAAAARKATTQPRPSASP